MRFDADAAFDCHALTPCLLSIPFQPPPAFIVIYSSRHDAIDFCRRRLIA